MIKKNSSIIITTIFTALLIAALFLYDQQLALVAFILFLGVTVYSVFSQISHNKSVDQELKKVASDIESSEKSAGASLPLPIVVISDNGNIRWYNKMFNALLAEIVEEKESYNMPIKDLLPELDLELIRSGFGQEEIHMGERIFNITIEKTEDNDKTLLYLHDITDLFHISAKYRDERLTIALVNVDNYDEVMNDVKDDKQPFVSSEIEKSITTWALSLGAMIKKYSVDKYLVVFTYEKLIELEQLRFSILDDIRAIDAGNKIPVTLSIGIAYGTEKPSELEKEAFSCLELALGRGGDQAVLKKKGNYEFFGGKSKAVERRNKVKARVIAHGFRSLIDESSKVIVMGHRVPDMDAFGACVGVTRAVNLRNKKAYIVSASITEAIDPLYNIFKDNPDYNFLTADEAIDSLDDKTLLVVVDTHKASITESPELVEKADRVVVIDHHRRATEFIDKAVVKYMEPYASSASELVTEMLQYMANKVSITKDEADALLAGITLDTKYFSIMTGVRTFDAASFLKEHGANTVRVRQFFQDDLEVFRLRASIVGDAQIIHDNIAISSSDAKSTLIQMVSAQAADELLNIKGTAASFVIAQRNDGLTFISGRSLGEVNVQVILEKIGGGGHLEVAGAQFEDSNVDEVKEILLGAIAQYYDEAEQNTED